MTVAAPPARTFYRPREVAALFEMSLSSVYRHIEAGSLPAARIGGSWRVPVAELHQRFPALPPPAGAGPGR